MDGTFHICVYQKELTEGIINYWEQRNGDLQALNDHKEIRLTRIIYGDREAKLT